MSFGVGIGDILVVTKVGFTLWANIRGAKKEREDLTANLMEWKAKLEIVKPMLASEDLSPPAAQLAEEQLSAALLILQVLEELNRKLVKGKVLRQAAWEVRGRERFQQYQIELEKKLGMLDMLFLCGSMKAVTERVKAVKDGVKEVTEEVRETNVVLKRVENGIKYLGFSPDHEPVRFIDALNGQRLLPWELCLKWEDFRSLIQMSFKESAGRSFVALGEYEIINEENGALLRAEDWGNTVRPGALLSMAIVLRKKKVSESPNDYRCPGCETEYTGPVGTSYELERVKCTYCKRWFQISSEARVAEIEAPGKQGNSSFDSGKISKDNELMHIRRFHIRVEEITLKSPRLERRRIIREFESSRIEELED